jgi:hypothetical protein
MGPPCRSVHCPLRGSGTSTLASILDDLATPPPAVCVSVKNAGIDSPTPRGELMPLSLFGQAFAQGQFLASSHEHPQSNIARLLCDFARSPAFFWAEHPAFAVILKTSFVGMVDAFRHSQGRRRQSLAR